MGVLSEQKTTRVIRKPKANMDKSVEVSTKQTVKINPEHYDTSGKLTASGLIAKLHSTNAKSIKIQVLERVRRGISDISLLDNVQSEVISKQVDMLFNQLADMAKGNVDDDLFAAVLKIEDNTSIPSMDDLLVHLENGLKEIINTAISNCSVLDLSILRF